MDFFYVVQIPATIGIDTVNQNGNYLAHFMSDVGGNP
jgi:hypothetical protein